MPLFSTRRTIPSCFVDKPLLQRLEDYIRQQVERLPRNRETESLSVEITDKTGTETLGSIKEFGHPRFFNGTKKITVEYRGYRPDRLEVNVSFSKGRDDSELRVRYSGDGARESVTGLVAGIEGILVQAKTFNSWFRPHGALDALIFGLSTGIVPLVALGMFTAKTPPTPALRSLLVSGLFIPGYFLFRFLKPYSTFDTTGNRALSVVGNWLVAGIAGFLLFTVVGVYLRVRWLGF